jgi:hypothetical protein
LGPSEADDVFLKGGFQHAPCAFETGAQDEAVASFDILRGFAVFMQDRVALQDMAKLPFVVLDAPFSGCGLP